jgi:hypothetical protein
MTSIPLVSVAVLCRDLAGAPMAGAAVTAQLCAKDARGGVSLGHEFYQGVIVPSRIETVSDQDGCATLRLFPNELGRRSSFYQVTIQAPDGAVALRAVVPNRDCNLWDVLEYETFPPEYWSSKATRPNAPVAGHFASLDSRGDLLDSGYGPNDFTGGEQAASYPAGEALGGLRVVYLAQDGALRLADPAVAEHGARIVGVTLAAAEAGKNARVRVAGVVSESSWNWSETLPILVGAAGVPTQTAPSGAFTRVIGFPAGPTALCVQLQPPIFS